jgi:hypothetical protein
MSDSKPRGLTWWQRFGATRFAIVKAGKAAGHRVHQVAVQAVSKAKLTGEKLARHIVAVQKAAGLDPRIMRESVQSVANRRMTRPADRAWQRAYVAEAARQAPEVRREPSREHAPAEKSRPLVRVPGGMQADKEAGQ